jgi:hypothetical protein
MLSGGVFQMSTVKRVEQALNTPASEPINAESRPATTIPRKSATA